MDDVKGPPSSSDLVLADGVDLTNCDREAIHVPGGVQPHGALLGMDDDGRVVLCSDNAADLLAAPDGVLGSSVGALLRDATGDGPLVIPPASARRRLSGALTPDGRLLDLIVHAGEDLALLEFEPVLDAPVSAEDVLADMGEAVGDISRALDLDTARGLAVRTVRRFTGFDRVMFYRFHDDGHGEVVAESCREDLEPYLGLHYPAGDVPRQARQLYVRNWTRLIVDARATPSPLVAAPGAVRTPVNLAMAQLRAVSPIHLEYLRNMGVRTSMSLSIVVDGELVGLIACHHQSVQHVPFAVRSAVEVLARVLSEQIARASTRAANDLAAEQRRVQLRVLRAVAAAATPAGALGGMADESLALVGATGFRGRLAGEELIAGETELSSADVEELLAAADGDVVAVEDLASVLPGHHGGALAVRVGSATAGDHLAWTRPGVARTVTWAGDPTANVEDNGDRLTPRRSFEAWVESVESRCAPWSVSDRGLARMLGGSLGTTLGGSADTGERDASAVIDTLLARNREAEEANAALQRLATEREEMVSVVAHDLRGPLRSVSGFVDVLLARVGTDDAEVEMAGDRITSAVRSMDALLDGLQRWGRLADAAVQGVVDLGQAVDTALEGLRAQLDGAGAVVHVGLLPSVRGDAVLLREVVQNLVENAVRYRSPDRPLEIHIGARTADQSAVLTVRDNGAGFSPAVAGEIFGMFRQAGPVTSEGIGLGLALVARIVGLHGGEVWADGTPGKGATFHVRLRLAVEIGG